MVRRSPLVLAILAACGGASPAVQTAPLPDDPSPAAPVATGSASASAPGGASASGSASASGGASAGTAAPAGPSAPGPAASQAIAPVERTIPAVASTVKLVSGGTGKKAALRYVARPGKQPIELALDFSGEQDTQREVLPTLVLRGDVDVRDVSADGSAQYVYAVTAADARPVAGAVVSIEQFKTVANRLTGLTITGRRSATGVPGEVTLRLEEPAERSAEALELVRLTLPVLPVLPVEPVGVGAKWQVSTPAKLADRLDVTQITDYEVIGRKAAAWTIRGTTRVVGKDQELEGSPITAIGGTGTSELVLSEAARHPTYRATLQTQFTASAKDASAQFVLKVGGAVGPRAPAAK